MNHIIDCEKFALAAVNSIDGEIDAKARASHAIDVYEAAYESCVRRNEPLEEENKRITQEKNKRSMENLSRFDM